jgi:hypothetical protein
MEASFARVKPKVEELINDLKDTSPEDELLILQLVLARWAAMQKFNLKGLLMLLAKNLQAFTPMWKAAIDAPEESRIIGLDGHPGFRRKP